MEAGSHCYTAGLSPTHHSETSMLLCCVTHCVYAMRQPGLFLPDIAEPSFHPHEEALIGGNLVWIHFYSTLHIFWRDGSLLQVLQRCIHKYDPLDANYSVAPRSKESKKVVLYVLLIDTAVDSLEQRILRQRSFIRSERHRMPRIGTWLCNLSWCHSTSLTPSLHIFVVKAFDTHINVTKEFFCPKLLFYLGWGHI